MLLDVRDRLAHVDWEALEETRRRRDRHTFAASLVSPDVRLLSEKVARCELEDSEFEMDVKDLVKLRLTLRKEINEKEKEKEALSKLQSLHAGEPGELKMPRCPRGHAFGRMPHGLQVEDQIRLILPAITMKECASKM
ncbi:hypothetical protein PsorP6_005109 [Peronosclerospora sorghi]|uniref:Uncharacterized protein n=1 Tax=Peronosclerospora sorghi TaxID=230839 RepID=A0ACC0W1R8_9STRA|nr:hypothetical protein PsorP6_005109 [Peronosclerospora sorghi]